MHSWRWTVVGAVRLHQTHGGEGHTDTQSQLEALDKIVAEYATYGRTIRAIRADGEFAAGMR